MLYFVNPPASQVLGTVLVGFALLEGLLNVCVGCHVYTYLVFPALGER